MNQIVNRKTTLPLIWLILLGCDSAVTQNEMSLAGKKLVIENAISGASFGEHIAVSGEFAIVGAPSDQSDPTRVGAAYILKKVESEWVEVAKLQPADEMESNFGRSVSIDGDYAVVGGKGAAYVFQRKGEPWVEVEKLSLFGANRFSSFGHSVSISRNTIVVGEPESVRIDIEDVGTAHVFEQKGGRWLYTGFVTEKDFAENDQFGASVSISGHDLIIGSPGRTRPNETGGAVYVFKREGSAWIQSALFTNAGYPRDVSREPPGFGWSVGISGDYAVVGSLNIGIVVILKRDGDSWVEAGRLSNDEAPKSIPDWRGFGRHVAIHGDVIAVGELFGSIGSVSGGEGVAYVFGRQGDSWKQLSALSALDGSRNDRFGVSVAVGAVSVLVGADGDDDAGAESGSAYFFEM